MWAPYPESVYQEALGHIRRGDVVLDLGAGDLRLALRMARVARRVYAVEMQARLIELALDAVPRLPPNLTVICQDARTCLFPSGVTVGVLLMRHCTHFRLYADKLKAVGCERLITNARWRTDVEAVFLHAPRQRFDQIGLGWYACWCGQTGFKTGPVEQLNEETQTTVYEVFQCPHCR